jgi:hypothetical protein
MPFHFMCPQGHLLEGQEAQMGQQTQCPLCGQVMIVPVVGPQPAAVGPHGMPWPGPASGPSGQWPQQPPWSGASGAPSFPSEPPGAALVSPPAQTPPEETHFPRLGAPASTPPAAESPEAISGSAAPPQVAEPVEEEPQLVHISCPNGHELETPSDMLGHDAMCPQCRVQFQLRYEDSREYKEEKRKARERRDEQFSRKALNWAIGAAVFVVLAIILMIIISASGGFR